MGNRFNLLAVLSLYLAGTNVVYALSCKNGTSSCSTQSAADCAKLGYSADNVDNCKHYLYCPFNTNYKTCVAFDNSEPEPNCSDYPLTECPEHGICDECPDDKNYLKFTGCESGYILNADKTKCLDPCDKSADEHCKSWSSELEDCECTECEDFYEKKNGKCVPMTCDDGNETADDCKDTETYIVDKTLLNNEVCGHCVECADENDPNSPCKGYYTCSGGGRSPKGDVKCTCGNVNYYEDCEVIETCFIESYSYCFDNYSDTSSYYNNPYNLAPAYLLGEKCTTLNNKKIYTWALCDEDFNCLGPSITNGLGLCDYDYGIGEPVECGGRKYFFQCNKCYTSSKKQYGSDAVRGEDLQWHLSNGYYLIKKLCTEDSVTMYLVDNCASNGAPADGLQTCEGDQGSGKTVECGGKKYFQSCDETCYATKMASYCLDSTNPDLIKETTHIDYYLIRTKCTKLDGKTKVYQYADCESKQTNCIGNRSPVYGMQACEDGDGIGTAVKCGNHKFYKQCGGCDSTLNTSSYPGCNTATTDLNYWTLNAGDYIAGEKCTKVDGSKVYLTADCTVKKDCKGNKGPAYGLKTCPSGYYHTGTVKECGGMIYASDCAVSCKYEQKESDCSDGETFTPYCLDANRVWYGECK